MQRLTRKELIELIKDDSNNLTITRPSSDSYQVKIRPKFYECYSCNTLTSFDSLEIRLDARVPSLTLPKKFCKTCIKSVDELLLRLKTKTIPNWVKSSNLRMK